MTPNPSRPRIRMWPLVVLALAALAAYLAGVSELLTLDGLRSRALELHRLVADQPWLAALAYVALYACTVALSLPGASALTIAGGFLFGLLPGALLAVIGATLGAVGLFTIAKSSLGEPLRARAGPWLKKASEAFNRNAVGYLLTLRLLPLVPFWLVNILPAFLGMRLLPYTLATFIGIMPGAFLYASLGEGLLGAAAAADPRRLWDWRVLLPLVALALLTALVPLYRNRQERRAAARRRGR